jgi:hypothetical protein
MFILYFYGLVHQYHHSVIYRDWTNYDLFRPGESLWLVPGTDPEDDAYGREYPEHDEDVNEGDENDETLEYMCELLEAREVEPDEFRRQLLSVGYHPDTISRAIASAA